MNLENTITNLVTLAFAFFMVSMGVVFLLFEYDMTFNTHDEPAPMCQVYNK